MALCTVNEVLKETVQKKYAVGAFDIPDLHRLRGKYI